MVQLHVLPTSSGTVLTFVANRQVTQRPQEISNSQGEERQLWNC